MADKRKIHFMELSFLFGAITMIMLLNQWGYSNPFEMGSEMMNGGMGNMMTSMHGQGITLADLIRQEEVSDVSSNSSSHNGHHEDSHLSGIHYFTTMTIIVLLPLIIAGTVFLTIVWLK